MGYVCTKQAMSRQCYLLTASKPTRYLTSCLIEDSLSALHWRMWHITSIWRYTWSTIRWQNKRIHIISKSVCICTTKHLQLEILLIRRKVVPQISLILNLSFARWWLISCGGKCHLKRQGFIRSLPRKPISWQTLERKNYDCTPFASRSMSRRRVLVLRSEKQKCTLCYTFWSSWGTVQLRIVRDTAKFLSCCADNTDTLVWRAMEHLGDSRIKS